MTLPAVQRDALVAAGQEHALEFLDRLEGAPHERLAGELASIDADLVGELFALTRSTPEAPSSLEPPELFPLERSPAEVRRAEEATHRGEELLAAGKVGFVLVAGGQASRLGYDAPKGAFPIGPVTGRSLFAFHAHRLAAVRERYGVSVPWYVMTSAANAAATAAFFEEHDFLGLVPEDVFFFRQDMLPALDEEGRILFATPEHVFLAPNGHGGCLLALESSGALDDIRRRGLEQLSYFQVDNPLVRPADPLFLGLHALEEAQMSTKVVAKRDAAEKVGVIGRIDGRMGCIEYSDLPEELLEAREEGGQLRFRAGNMAIHVLSLGFLEGLHDGELVLPWHVARKSMRGVTLDGGEHEVTGFKFETFVFDALGAATHSVTLEIDRREEFSPVKNREGDDSPASARRDLCRLYEGWVSAAGGELPPPDEGGIRPIEVDPRYAETQDEFLARGRPAPDVRPTGHLYGP